VVYICSVKYLYGLMNKQILKEIRTLKRRILPNEKVYLFGSQARGDAREDSDRKVFELRQKGDYGDWVIIDEQIIKPLIEPAEKFITEIEKLINQTT